VDMADLPGASSALALGESRRAVRLTPRRAGL
jgi:hypothetical protein